MSGFAAFIFGVFFLLSITGTVIFMIRGWEDEPEPVYKIVPVRTNHSEYCIVVFANDVEFFTVQDMDHILFDIKCDKPYYSHLELPKGYLYVPVFGPFAELKTMYERYNKGLFIVDFLGKKHVFINGMEHPSCNISIKRKIDLKPDQTQWSIERDVSGDLFNVYVPISHRSEILNVTDVSSPKRSDNDFAKLILFGNLVKHIHTDNQYSEWDVVYI